MANKKAAASPNEYKILRVKLGLNQSEFWSRINITQSGGSRYETGRNVPAPVKALIELAYGTKANALKKLAKLRGITVEELIGAEKK